MLLGEKIICAYLNLRENHIFYDFKIKPYQYRFIYKII